MRVVFLTVLASTMSACSIPLKAVWSKSGWNNETDMVTVTTTPPGANIFDASKEDLRYLGISPLEAPLSYETQSSFDPDSLAWWVAGTGIDLGLAGAFGYAYQTESTSLSKGQALVGAATFGAFVLIDIIAQLASGSEPAKQARILAQHPAYGDSVVSYTHPVPSEVHIKLLPGRPNYTAAQLKNVKIPRATLGRMLVTMPDAASNELARMLSNVLVGTAQRFNKDECWGMSDVEAMSEYKSLGDVLGCTDVRCGVEIGGALGARYVLSTKFETVEKKATLVVEITERGSNAPLAKATRNVTGAYGERLNEVRLTDMAMEAMAELLGNLPAYQTREASAAR